MAYDAEDTRRRIFTAATAEFAERGLAGARVDRIATAARANKQAIYLYFGSKEKLFAAVLRAKLEEIRVSITIDPGAVAESVGQVFDWYHDHPELIRLQLWEALEVRDPADGSDAQDGADDAGGAGAPGADDDARREAFREKVRLLAGRDATGEPHNPGDPDDRVAQDLLFTLMGLIAWNFAVPRMCRAVLDEDTDEAALARRRATVVATARTLVSAAGAGAGVRRGS